MAPIAILYRMFAALIVYYLSRSIYRLYFHPLRNYPGPRLWAITRVSQTYYRLTGQLPFVVKRLHDQYGGVVRVGFNTLSYNTSEAWDKIYGFPTGGSKSFDKDLSERANIVARVGVPNILGANDEDHRRMRRLQAHAFSEKALSAQESVIQGYVSQFIRGLGQEAEASKTGLVSLGTWFNFATFDIIGDLAFAESFDCLEKGVMNPWIQTIFKSLKPGNMMVEAGQYPIGKLLLAYLLPKLLGKSAVEHKKFSADKADRRMQTQTDRPDFMSYILKHNETEKGMSPAEIREGASVFILAGSETTASLLIGLTYQLLQNPSTAAKLTTEIRNTFKTAGEMTLHKLVEMEYLQGCLEEGLRMFPPVPATLPRLVPSGGETICGEFVPEGVSVGVNQWAANYSSTNFLRPYEFHAERWLGGKKFAADNRKARQPFSAGPRNCIGKNLAYAEMRLLMASLLWHFDVELAEESRDWMQRNQIYTLWLKPELKVKLTPRKL